MLDSATDLRSLLKDPGLLPNKAYVAGQWIDAADGATFAVTNPARGDVIATVPDLTRADTARAIDRKSTRLNSSHLDLSRMPSSA